MSRSEHMKTVNPEAWERDRKYATDRVFQAMGDFVISYGFESLMTVVGAGLVAAHEIADLPDKPPPKLDFHEELYRDRDRHGELLHPDPVEDD